MQDQCSTGACLVVRKAAPAHTWWGLSWPSPDARIGVGVIRRRGAHSKHALHPPRIVPRPMRRWRVGRSPHSVGASISQSTTTVLSQNGAPLLGETRQLYERKGRKVTQDDVLHGHGEHRPLSRRMGVTGTSASPRTRPPTPSTAVQMGSCQLLSLSSERHRQFNQDSISTVLWGDTAT